MKEPEKHIVKVQSVMTSRHQSPWHIPVREAMTRTVFSCAPGDDVDTALALMGSHHVRRLPVVDGRHRLRGVISIDDAARHTGRAEGHISPDTVVRTLRRLSAHGVSA